MRRTSGRPASATSMGMATAVSSSSAPMAAFWTMTLKMGADRSGKTSRRSPWSATAPKADSARASTTVRPGRAKDVRSTRPTREDVGSVAMVFTSSGGLLDFRLEEEGAVHHHLLADLQAGEHLHVVSQRAAASHFAPLEGAALSGGQEGHPAVLQSLERGGGHGGDGAIRAAERNGSGGGHAWLEQALTILQHQPHGDGARGRIHALPHVAHPRRQLLAREGGEGDARLGVLLDAHRVALEGVDDEPQRAQITDAEERMLRVRHLSHPRVALDDGAGDGRA